MDEDNNNNEENSENNSKKSSESTSEVSINDESTVNFDTVYKCDRQIEESKEEELLNIDPYYWMVKFLLRVAY